MILFNQNSPFDFANSTNINASKMVIEELYKVQDLALYDRKGLVTIGKIGKEQPHSANIRIDRGTIFGNPYRVQKYGRDECCEMYDVWFHHQRRIDVIFKSTLEIMVIELIRGRDINLMCHCSPNRCHGETIKKYLEDMIG